MGFGNMTTILIVLAQLSFYFHFTCYFLFAKNVVLIVGGLFLSFFFFFKLCLCTNLTLQERACISGEGQREKESISTRLHAGHGA